MHDKTSKKLNLSHLKHYQCDDEYGAASPVGKFEPNAAGLYDMLGNASEWCEDEYDASAYGKHQHKNPLFKNKSKIKTQGNPKSDNGKKPVSVSSSRVIRGGSWKTGAKHVRCAGRDHFLYKVGKNHIGFRLVRTP